MLPELPSPFYSARNEFPHVYHLYMTQCGAASQIHFVDMRYGTDGRRLCLMCEMIQARDSSLPPPARPFTRYRFI